MQKVEQYKFENIFTEGGFVRSFTLPDRARKIIGVYFLLDFKGMQSPVHGFEIGRVSVLLNNKTDNTMHDFPLRAFADKNGALSMGDHYNFKTHRIALNTEVRRSNVFSLIYKDSGFMQSHIATEPALYGAYNPDLIMYVNYNDERGDWSNNEFNEVRLLRQ